MSSIMITGGTGTFGNEMVKLLLEQAEVERIVIYSRDEFKQQQMQQQFGEFPGGRLRFFLGDVRDRNRLARAMKGIDIVFHAAALKQIPSCEYNPMEAVKTNILGAKNVIEAAVQEQVLEVIALSTDKAVNPINLYGATKLVAEKLFIQANIYGEGTRFNIVRYGNVLASRGSVVDIFRRQAQEKGKIQITDRRMTRFWWTVKQAAKFTFLITSLRHRGVIYIPWLMSASVYDLAALIAPQARIEVIGARQGEKIHEWLVAPEEVDRSYGSDFACMVLPNSDFFTSHDLPPENTRVEEHFRYCSDSTHPSKDWLEAMLREVDADGI